MLPRIPQTKLDSLRRLFLSVIREKEGGEFISFATCDWLKGDEVGYKHEVWDDGTEALDLDDWPHLLESPGGISGRVADAMRRARNLVPLRYGDASFLGWTAAEGDVRRELELLTLKLMAAGESPAEVMGHLDELCLFLGDHHLPCQWQPLSYLLFLRDPDAFFPVHAGHFQRLLDFLGVPVRIYGRVTGEGMTALLELADVLTDDLADLGPRDLIDVHSYMWVVARRLPPAGATIHTVAYGGRAPSDFVALLKAHGIATIADVRLHPQKAMMGAYAKAKTPDKGIQRLLGEAGIRYEWLEGLGNPFMGDEDWADQYRQLMAASGEERAAPLLKLKGPVCLLCAEKKPDDCHRRLVAEWLEERGWEVVHLV